MVGKQDSPSPGALPPAAPCGHSHGRGNPGHTCTRSQAGTTQRHRWGAEAKERLRPERSCHLVLHLPSSHLEGLSPTVPAAEVFLRPHQHAAAQKVTAVARTGFPVPRGATGTRKEMNCGVPCGPPLPSRGDTT